MLATGYLYLGKLLTFDFRVVWLEVKAIQLGFCPVGKKGFLGMARWGGWERGRVDASF